MITYQHLCARLPSLYRPEAGDQTLVNRILDAWGFTLDAAAGQIQHVLRAHWFDTADYALFDAHYQLDRRGRGRPTPNLRDPSDAREVDNYPYVRDAAELAALLHLPPWLEPSALRESVEEYRQRVLDVVAAYRQGLTTLSALRRLVEAALPEDMAAPLWQRRWPFAIEEPVALAKRRVAITVPDVLEGELVSPLFRWSLEPHAGVPTVYLQAGPSGAVRPAIECFTPGQAPAGVALGYAGTLAADTTLRLAPARRTWLASASGLLASQRETLDNAGSDPSNNGPFAPVTPAPAGQMRRFALAADHALWCIQENAGSFALARFDGALFSQVSLGAGAAPLPALLAHGRRLFVASAGGLLVADLFPAGDYTFEAVAAVPEPVHALWLADGQLFCAGDDGVAVLDADLALVERRLAGVRIRCGSGDRARLHVATDQSLLLCEGERWFRYEGAALSEDRADWIAIEPSEAATATSPLPPLNAIVTTPDGILWLGTERGLAAYAVAGETTTILQAFPDVVAGSVRDLVVDERGMLWIASASGLFRYDGRDLAQYLSDARWSSLGRADTVYPDATSAEPRGHFRFDATDDRWERFTPAAARFEAVDLPLRAATAPPIFAVFFSPSVRAELGSFDGDTFTPSSSVADEDLVVRIKPDQTRIVTGGLPALGPAAATATTGLWRYLELEPDELEPPPGRPWWSCEGRLFMPPDADAPWPGHFREPASSWHFDGHWDTTVLPPPVPDSDGAIFAYPPSVRLWMEYAPAPRVGVRIRLFRRAPDLAVDPAIIDRVLELARRARAAGVRLELAVEGTVVKEAEQ